MWSPYLQKGEGTGKSKDGVDGLEEVVPQSLMQWTCQERDQIRKTASTVVFSIYSTT